MAIIPCSLYYKYEKTGESFDIPRGREKVFILKDSSTVIIEDGNGDQYFCWYRGDFRKHESWRLISKINTPEESYFDTFFLLFFPKFISAYAQYLNDNIEKIIFNE